MSCHVMSCQCRSCDELIDLPSLHLITLVAGTILGMAKADPVFDSWIEGSGSDLRSLSCDRHSNNGDTVNGGGYGDAYEKEEGIVYVEYIPVVARIVTVLEIILRADHDDDNEDGLDGWGKGRGRNRGRGDSEDGVDESKLSWVLKEFKFLDALLDQVLHTSKYNATLK